MCQVDAYTVYKELYRSECVCDLFFQAWIPSSSCFCLRFSQTQSFEKIAKQKPWPRSGFLLSHLMLKELSNRGPNPLLAVLLRCPGISTRHFARS